MQQALEGREIYRKFWLENLIGRYHLENQGIYVRIILKRILNVGRDIVTWIHLV
jgi:hypothetical protein